MLKNATDLRRWLLCALLVSAAHAAAASAEVVAVVSARSPVGALSKDQVVDIFLGKSARFPNGQGAIPIDLADGSDTRAEFYSSFANRSTAQIRTYWSKIIFTGRGQSPREALSVEEMKKLVTETPGAIGYIDRKNLDGSVKVVASP